jgi:hypothetical protein
MSSFFMSSSSYCKFEMSSIAPTSLMSSSSNCKFGMSSIAPTSWGLTLHPYPQQSLRLFNCFLFLFYPIFFHIPYQIHDRDNVSTITCGTFQGKTPIIQFMKNDHKPYSMTTCSINPLEDPSPPKPLLIFSQLSQATHLQK